MNNEIKFLLNLTKFNYVQTDTIITSNNGNPKGTKHDYKAHQTSIYTQIDHDVAYNICSQMPKNIFIFVGRALIFSLPNNSNLCRWGKIVSASCILCTSNKQTQPPYAI